MIDFQSLSRARLHSAGIDRKIIRGLFEDLRLGDALQQTPYKPAFDQVLRSSCPDSEIRVDPPATDRTVRFVLPVRETGAVEAVVIPNRSRSTACVSVQVGCRRGCVFCATGRMGRIANLSAGQIVAQVAWAARVARQHDLPPVRNLVFMGMGEPLDNAKATQQALQLLTEPGGWAFAPRHITVSSVGPSVRAVALARSWPCRIAWSLHAADEALRRALIPTAKASVAELSRAFLELVMARRQPLFVEMTLIDGLNDGEADAARAAELFAGHARRVRFNLLPVNPTDSGHRPSPPARVEAFREQLRARGFFAMIRKPRGRDGRAACGQLVTLPTAR